MRKKIFRTTVLTSFCVLLICLLLVSGFLYRYFTGLQKDMLSDQLSLAVHGVHVCNLQVEDRQLLR